MQINVDVIKDNLDKIQAIAQIVQTVVSAIAIIIGGFWVYITFTIKREKLPRANIQHQIKYRYLTKEKILLTIFVVISNDGNVLLSLEKGEIVIQQIFPLPKKLLILVNKGEDIVKLLNSLQEKNKMKEWQTEAPWPCIGVRETTWGKGSLEIEPGNCIQLPFDFTIDSEVQTVRIRSFFPNVVKRKRAVYQTDNYPKWFFWKKRRYAIGWLTITDFDLTIPTFNQSLKRQ